MLEAYRPGMNRQSSSQEPHTEQVAQQYDAGLPADESTQGHVQRGRSLKPDTSHLGSRHADTGPSHVVDASAAHSVPFDRPASARRGRRWPSSTV